MISLRMVGTNNPETMNERLASIHSARGHTSRMETSPIHESPLRNLTLNKSFDYDQSHSRMMTLEEASFIFTPHASKELKCGCECMGNDAMYCDNARNWLKLFYQDTFDYTIYCKTYEGFLQSSPKL